jgi:hypothetical protein
VAGARTVAAERRPSFFVIDIVRLLLRDLQIEAFVRRLSDLGELRSPPTSEAALRRVWGG